MKYRLKFYSNSEVVLPIQYNHIMQAALLNWIGDQNYSRDLHDGGYKYEKRSLKFHTFSNLYGKYKYYSEEKQIGFTGEIYFLCSFYEEESNGWIAKSVEKQKPLQLKDKKLAFISCEVIEEEYESCIIDTVSPITIHSTVELPNGRKRTYYYEPYEREFSEMIRQNLLRKYQAVYGQLPENQEFHIITLNEEKYKQVSIYYKKFVIKGWRGRFIIKGSNELIKLALLAGIGARNGIGCGCIIQKKVI